jgi:predicted methyltransferase
MDNETPEWRNGVGMHRIVDEPTKQLEIENPRIAELIYALKMMDRQQREYPHFLGGLTNATVMAMKGLVGHYMEISKSVAYIKTMEKSYQEWQEMQKISITAVISKTDFDDVESDEPTTDNKETT